MLTRLFFLTALLLFVSACGPTESTGSQSSGETVDWPALKTLDHQVIEMEALMNMENTADLLAQQVGRVLGTMSTLQAGGVPANVKQPELVEQKMEELRALALEIQQSADNLGEAPLAALHPLVADVMEAAGMPHVHDEHEHDHHHDHDHDH